MTQTPYGTNWRFPPKHHYPVNCAVDAGKKLSAWKGLVEHDIVHGSAALLISAEQ